MSKGKRIKGFCENALEPLIALRYSTRSNCIRARKQEHVTHPQIPPEYSGDSTLLTIPWKNSRTRERGGESGGMEMERIVSIYK